jgi:hypothetical protein
MTLIEELRLLATETDHIRTQRALENAADEIEHLNYLIGEYADFCAGIGENK